MALPTFEAFSSSKDNKSLTAENLSASLDEEIISDNDIIQDDCDSENDEDHVIDSYSIEGIWVTGYRHLSDYQKKYIKEDIKVGDYVYLRNEYDNPVDNNALIVLHEGIRIGYIQAHKAEFVLELLRKGKIGHICVTKIDICDKDDVRINIDIYYQDQYGHVKLPYYPLEGRQICVVQHDLWTDQKNYLEDWHLLLFTNQLCYKFKEMYDSRAQEDDTMISLCFDIIIKNYLNGTWITKDSVEKTEVYLKHKESIKIVRKMVESYMDYMDYHFFDS